MKNIKKKFNSIFSRIEENMGIIIPSYLVGSLIFLPMLHRNEKLGWEYATIDFCIISIMLLIVYVTLSFINKKIK